MTAIMLQIAKFEKGARGEDLTKDEIKLKNATMLCIYRLFKMEEVEETKISIKVVIGEKFVVSFFLRQIRDFHKGSANMQCLNLIIYKEFINKTLQVFGKDIAFTPHPHSL